MYQLKSIFLFLGRAKELKEGKNFIENYLEKLFLKDLRSLIKNLKIL